MMKSITTRIGAVAAVAAASIMVASSPAQALDGYRHGYGRGYGHEFHEHRGHDDRYRRGGYYRVSGYDDGYRGYRNNGYRGHRCRDKGVGGAVIGAIAGGLLGNAVAGRGNRTTGTVVGGAVGAVAGHAIDKQDGRPC